MKIFYYPFSHHLLSTRVGLTQSPINTQIRYGNACSIYAYMMCPDVYSDHINFELPKINDTSLMRKATVQ